MSDGEYYTDDNDRLFCLLFSLLNDRAFAVYKHMNKEYDDAGNLFIDITQTSKQPDTYENSPTAIKLLTTELKTISPTNCEVGDDYIIISDVKEFLSTAQKLYDHRKRLTGSICVSDYIRRKYSIDGDTAIIHAAELLDSGSLSHFMVRVSENGRNGMGWEKDFSPGPQKIESHSAVKMSFTPLSNGRIMITIDSNGSIDFNRALKILTYGRITPDKLTFSEAEREQPINMRNSATMPAHIFLANYPEAASVLEEINRGRGR